MDLSTFLLGLLIFGARIIDVGIGTFRTITIVQGRMVTAFLLGLIEVSLWIVVISTVIAAVKENPVLIVFYALGFSTGSVVGIWVEGKLAFGQIVLRIISREKGKEIAAAVRKSGQAVTIFQGEGMEGAVNLLYIVCERKHMQKILNQALEVDQEIFYITETPGRTRRYRQQLPGNPTGWRAVFKRK